MNKITFLVLPLALICSLFLTACGDDAETVGEVTSNYRFFTPSDKIKIEKFHDPDIPEIVLYVSRADRGGIKGAMGLAEDKSDASLAARLVRPLSGPIPDKVLKSNGDEIFRRSQSLVFKKMLVRRFYDKENNVVIYITHSREMIAGGYKNSISVVPLDMPLAGS